MHKSTFKKLKPHKYTPTLSHIIHKTRKRLPLLFLPHTLLRLRLVERKIFFKCKIFSGENIFEKGKYFQVFGCIMKIVLENVFMCLVAFWKCYFSTSFSHFLSHFLSFQTNFIIENSIDKLKKTKIKTKSFVKLKQFGQTERGRKREWSKIEGKG